MKERKQCTMLELIKYSWRDHSNLRQSRLQSKDMISSVEGHHKMTKASVLPGDIGLLDGCGHSNTAEST